MIQLFFFIPVTGASAQQAIELNSASYTGSIPNGPTVVNQVANFRQNTTGTTFTALTNPVSVTAALSNQQYTGLAGNMSSGVTFGAVFASISNSPNVTGMPVFSALNGTGSPANASFTSNPYGSAGTGINVAQNYAFFLFSTANMWIGTSGPSGRRAYYADITFNFSRPVSDPVIHVSGLGAVVSGGNNFSTEFELPSGSGFTLTKLSGSSELVVPATNDKILNGASSPNTSCGSGAACGSVRINGTNISSVTFKIYVRFRTSSFPATFASGSEGDAYTISFSFAAFNLSGTVYNDANGLTDNTVNGSVTNAGGQLYALAADAVGKIQGSTSVSATGTFSFPNLVKGPYTVRLSTAAASFGSDVGSATLPSGWISTGEYRGTGAGSDGNPDASLSDNIITSDLNNFNLGIERRPVAYDIFYQLLTKEPDINSLLALNGAIGSPPVGNSPIRPNGDDVEDGVLSAGKTLEIITLPVNGTLLYNSIPVTAGQVITGFDPNLLEVKFTGRGYKTIVFTYRYKDAAQISSLPATYTIVWDFLLPVDLASFTATFRQDNTVLLKWQTSTEQNTRGFHVQHSTDGRSWETLDFVAGAWNNNTSSDYSYVHRNVNSRRHYYRLQQEDTDGKIKLSHTRLVNIGGKYDLQVYPNPAQNGLYIVPDSRARISEVTLLDIAGRQVLIQKYLQNGLPLDISRLKAGTYLLKVQYEDGETSYKKIIKR